MTTAAERLEDLYIPAILDVMEDGDYHDFVLPVGIAAIDRSMRLVGPAYPCQFVPSTSRDKDAIYGGILEAYEAAPAGSIFVVATTPDGPESSHFGELSATTCQAAGLRGALIDGGVRDCDFIVRTGFPVFGRFRTPKDVLGRWEVAQHGQAVAIDGITIRPGDVICGDWDGTVVIPHEDLDVIVAAAEECVRDEDAIRERLKKAELPSVLYREYGRF